MANAICFIEDEIALSSYIVDLRESERFPGWQITAAESVDEALELVSGLTGSIIFVIDSRMVMSDEIRERLEPLLKERKLSFLDFTASECEMLTGTLCTVLLRKIRPECKIIMVSAFKRGIEEIRMTNPALDALVTATTNAFLSKQEPSMLTFELSEQVAGFVAR